MNGQERTAEKTVLILYFIEGKKAVSQQSLCMINPIAEFYKGGYCKSIVNSATMALF